MKKYNDPEGTKQFSNASSDFYQSQLFKYQLPNHTKTESEDSQPMSNLKIIYPDEMPIVYIQKKFKEIYNNNIPIKIKSQTNEYYYTYLRFQILKSSRETLQQIRINLTDDDNNLFLWIFQLDETRFLRFKEEQNIKTNFNTFPQMIIEHLGFLQDQKQAQTNSVFFRSSFQIDANNEQGILNILQSNKYKQSLHLSLKFKYANDKELKQYLSDKLNNAYEFNQGLRIQNSKLSENLRQKVFDLQQLELQYQQLCEEKLAELKKFDTELKEKDDKLKKYYEIKEKEFIFMKNEEIENLKEEYQKKIELISQKLIMNMNKVTNLEQNMLHYVQTNKTLKMENELLVKQFQQSKQKIERNLLYIKQLEQKRIQHTNLLTILQSKIQQLEMQLKDKQQIIKINQELKTNILAQTKVLQNQFHVTKKNYQKLNQKYQNSVEQNKKLSLELQQSNQNLEIITQKISFKTQLITIKERQNNQLQNLVASLDSKFSIRQNQLIQQNTSLKHQLQHIKRKLSESQKESTSMNSLIDHLNKQLTQRTVGYKPIFSNHLNNSRQTSDSKQEIYSKTLPQKMSSNFQQKIKIIPIKYRQPSE